MDRKIQIIVSAQDNASATINAVSNNVKNQMGSMGSMFSKMLPTFMAWQALHGVFNTVGNAIGLVKDAIGSTVSVGMDFNKEMSAVGAITQATGQEFDQLRALAMEMGRDTVFTTTEAAVAIKEMGKAGVSTSDILSGGLKASLDLASAGELELAEAAEVMARGINAFALDGTQAGLVADALANAANAAATDVHNLGQAYKYVGPMMQSLTHDAYTNEQALLDTTTATAMLSQAGIDAGMAGAGLQRVLEGLTPNSEKATAQMEKLGLVIGNKNLFFDAQGNFIGLENAVGLLRDRMGELTQEERLVAIETMFGQRAGRVITTLMGQLDENSEAWREMYTEIADPGGAAETAAVKLNNMAGAIEFLRGSIEYIQTSIWTDVVEQRLSGGVGRIGELLNSIGQKVNESGVQAAFETIAKAVGDILGQQVDIWGPRILAFLDGLGHPDSRIAIAELGLAIQNLMAAVMGGDPVPRFEATQRYIEFYGSETAKGAPGIAESIAGGIDAIRKVVQGFADDIKDIKKVADWLNEVHAAVTEAGKTIGDAMRSGDWTEIKEWWTNTGSKWVADIDHQGVLWHERLTHWKNNKLAPWVQDVDTSFNQGFNLMWQSLLSGIETWSADMNAKANTWWSGVKLNWTSYMNEIKVQWNADWEAVKNKWNEISTSISTGLSNWWAGIKAGWNADLEMIKNAWNTGWTNIQTAFTTTKDTIVGLVTGFGTTLVSIITGFGPTLLGVWNTVWNGLTNWLTTTFGPNVSSAITTVGTTAASTALTVGASIVQGIIDGALSMATSLWNTLTSLANSAVQAAKDAILSESPSKRFRDEVGKPMMTGIMVGIDAEAPNVLNKIAQVNIDLLNKAKNGKTNTGKTVKDDFFEHGSEIGKQYTEGLAKGTNDGAPFTMSAVETLLSALRGAFDAFLSTLAGQMGAGGAAAGKAFSAELAANISIPDLPKVSLPSGITQGGPTKGSFGGVGTDQGASMVPSVPAGTQYWDEWWESNSVVYGSPELMNPQAQFTHAADSQPAYSTPTTVNVYGSGVQAVEVSSGWGSPTLYSTYGV